MTIEEITYSILTGYSGITATVGTKIYPIKVAQNKQVPFITYTILKGTPNAGKRELSSFDTYMNDIDIFSNKYSEVILMQNMVRSEF